MDENDLTKIHDFEEDCMDDLLWRKLHNTFLNQPQLHENVEKYNDAILANFCFNILSPNDRKKIFFKCLFY